VFGINTWKICKNSISNKVFKLLLKVFKESIIYHIYKIYVCILINHSVKKLDIAS
jgi:hypothetical protein